VLIVDTGPLVATADRDDADHVACDQLLAVEAPLITTALVIAEAAFLIAPEVGAAGEVALVSDVAEGRLVVDDLTREDWVRVHHLVERYTDLGLGATDASVIALAERHRATRIATLDHRHFRVVHPIHCHAFELVP